MLRQLKAFKRQLTVVLIQSNIMTMRVNGLTISDIEKTVAVNIKKTPSNRKHVFC